MLQIPDLPNHKDDHRSDSLGIFPSDFFSVRPFVEPLKQWIAKKQKQDAKIAQKRAQKVEIPTPKRATDAFSPHSKSAFKKYTNKQPTNLSRELVFGSGFEGDSRVAKVYRAKILGPLPAIRQAKSWRDPRIDWKVVFGL